MILKQIMFFSPVYKNLSDPKANYVFFSSHHGCYCLYNNLAVFFYLHCRNEVGLCIHITHFYGARGAVVGK